MTKEETNLIIAEQNKSTAEILEVIDKVKADFQELCDMRHRQVTELEKENSKLILGNKSLSEKLISVTREKLDLQKENAELKEHHKSVCETLTNTHRSIREQLTKAKELIEDIYDQMPRTHFDYYKDVRERAEQFLKDLEK